MSQVRSHSLKYTVENYVRAKKEEERTCSVEGGCSTITPDRLNFQVL